MKTIMMVLALPFMWLLSCQPASAHDKRQGYILKRDEGEQAAGAIIKASKKQGSNGAAAIFAPLPPKLSTWLHYHIEADEFFYVVSGSGVTTIGEENYNIKTGDFIFVPAGQDHEMTIGDAPLEVLEFVDKPGLADEFRIWHKTFSEGGAELTLEAVNAFARKHGTVYKTLD